MIIIWIIKIYCSKNQINWNNFFLKIIIISINKKKSYQKNKTAKITKTILRYPLNNKFKKLDQLIQIAQFNSKINEICQKFYKKSNKK